VKNQIAIPLESEFVVINSNGTILEIETAPPNLNAVKFDPNGTKLCLGRVSGKIVFLVVDEPNKIEIRRRSNFIN
jgi:hypothetical protein